ncbi:MAG: hypothetical protein JJ992_00795, partial [Planctomycetes bacterium]|nr:hypothetical protein [Planctomycetota bacterium]
SAQKKVVMLLSDGMQNVSPELEFDATLPGVTIGGTELPSDVYFYAVALGTTIDEDLFDDLANQGGIPSFYYGGSTTDIQTAFALWIADVLGLDAATSLGLEPESRFAASAADAGSESGLIRRYRVNPSVRRITFLLTWPEKGRDLRFRLETPAGPISLDEDYFHPDQGFGLVTIPVPFREHAPDAHIGEWRLILEPGDADLAAASAQPPSFAAHAFYDDPALDLRYSAGGEDPGAGEAVPLRVEVIENGNPVAGLTVHARAVGPEIGLGDILSEPQVAIPSLTGGPSIAAVAASAPPSGDKPPTVAAQKLASLLEQDPTLLNLAPREAILLSESHPGVYEAQLPASATAAAGTYDFRFQVDGTTPENGAIQREQRFSRYLRTKPDPAVTVVAAAVLPRTKVPTVRVAVTPLDRNGHRLGPGWARYVLPDTDAGRLVGTVTDNLDGSYVFDLAADSDYVGPLRIDILGASIVTQMPPLGGTGFPPWLWVLLIILLFLLWLRKNL